MSDSGLKKQVENKRNSDIISSKLAALSNNVRFSIIEILKEVEKKSGKCNPLYSREINSVLLSDYGINITPQMLSQHLRQLSDAELIMQVPTRKEVPNKIGKRNVKGYVLKEDAFENLLLDIGFLSEELLLYLCLHGRNQFHNSDDYCVLTVFNGADKGRTFKIHRSETILVGTRDDYELKELASFAILLDNSYEGVSKITQPHLKLFYQDGSWCVIDDASSNGTFVGNVPVESGVLTKLKNNSFLKLSSGEGSATLYCSF